MVAIQHQRTGLKGRPPLRRCPDDFAVIFVEKGREACEAWYRARKTTVTRWLIESGKVDLIDKRAAYVKSMRSQGKWMTRSSRLVEHHEIKRPTVRQSIIDRRDVPIAIARHAAQHLRVVRNGGFIVSQSTNGDWRVGTRLLSAAQMLDFACDKGFDVNGVAPEAPSYDGDFAVRKELILRATLVERGLECRNPHRGDLHGKGAGKVKG